MKYISEQGVFLGINMQHFFYDKDVNSSGRHTILNVYSPNNRASK